MPAIRQRGLLHDLAPDVDNPSAFQTKYSTDGLNSDLELEEGRSMPATAPGDRNGVSQLIARPLITSISASGEIIVDPERIRNSKLSPLDGEEQTAPNPARLRSGPSPKDRSPASTACLTCRSRKVRCDGVRPVCTNCTRRGTFCDYDSYPKRRGPDRQPGTRQRSAKGTVAPRRKKSPLKVITRLIPESQVQSHDVYVVGAALNGDLEYRRLGASAPPLQPHGLPGSSEPNDNAASSASPHDGWIEPSARPCIVPSQMHSKYAANSYSYPLQSNPSHPEFLNPSALPYIIPTIPPGPGPNIHRQTSESTYSSQSPPCSHFSPPTSLDFNTQEPNYTTPQIAGEIAPTWEQRISPGAVQEFEGRYQTPSDFHHDHGSDSALGYSEISRRTDGGYHTASISESEEQFIRREPTLRFSQDTWWDSVLEIYDPTSRERAIPAVNADILLFFKYSTTWMSCMNLQLFFNMFYHPEHRGWMQPSLVLGILAYSAYIQGSNLEGGEAQRLKATHLREAAQSAFDASYNAGWLDVQLGQAALILALYEFASHPNASSARMTSCLVLMDNVFRSLNLIRTDIRSPRRLTFSSRTVPALGRRALTYIPSAAGHVDTISGGISNTNNIVPQPPPQMNLTSFIGPRLEERKGCPCKQLSLGVIPSQARSTPTWVMTPGWDPAATYAEIRQEEARRLVWNSIGTVGIDAAARLSLGMPQLNLHISELQNYALLYPGEMMYAGRPEIDVAYSSVESTWALYCRVMLLWITCARALESDEEEPQAKSDFARNVWLETISIEEALDEHTCGAERDTLFMAREYIFQIRMHISHDYKRFIPIPKSGTNFCQMDRGAARLWLAHHSMIADQVKALIFTQRDTYAAKLILRRPGFVWVEMTIMSRALKLYELDPSLVDAVDVAIKVMPVVTLLADIWPCPEQRRRMARLFCRLRLICHYTGKQMPSSSFVPSRVE